MGDEAMADTVTTLISDEAAVRPSGLRVTLHNMASRAQREAMIAAATSAYCAGMGAWGASAAGAAWSWPQDLGRWWTGAATTYEQDDGILHHSGAAAGAGTVPVPGVDLDASSAARASSAPATAATPSPCARRFLSRVEVQGMRCGTTPTGSRRWSSRGLGMATRPCGRPPGGSLQIGSLNGFRIPIIEPRSREGTWGFRREQHGRCVRGVQGHQLAASGIRAPMPPPCRFLLGMLGDGGCLVLNLKGGALLMPGGFVIGK
ncbi:unnamed protein product [Urochloa humidicola]